MSTANFARPDLGLPPRPPTAETPLWEHLLRPHKEKVPTLQSMPLITPPLAPLDKNATSMRVLLHDTQANFEKFAKHVGQLLHEVKETHNEMKTTHSLFERDRESLMGDIIDLVNRSQKEVQKSVGSPSQHDTVETLFKDVNHRLSGLDQRLEALQSFNQTHSQALQTQTQATQILLDKQGSIIAAVVPLLPLLQAIPLHIDTAKSSLTETLTNLLSSHKPTAVTVPSPVSLADTAAPAPTVGKRKRLDTDMSFSMSPVQPSGTPFKKSRLDTGSLAHQGSVAMRSVLSASKTSAANTILETSSSPLKGLNAPFKFNSRPRISPTAVDAVSKAPTSLSSRSRRGTFAIPTTPRRPLGDLPIPITPTVSISRQSSTRKNTDLMNHALREASFGRSKTLAPAFPSAAGNRIPGMTPNPSRPPRILRVQENNVKRSLSVTSTDATAALVPDTDAAAVASIGRVNLRRRPGQAEVTDEGLPRRYPTRSRTNMSSVFATPSKVLSNGGHVLAEDTNSTVLNSKDVGAQSATIKPISALSSFIEGSSGTSEGRSTSVPLAVALGKQKERRSPMREGRRFIPLVDSDDEEEE